MERTIAYGELVNRLRLVEQRRGNEKRKSELRVPEPSRVGEKEIK